MVVVTDADIKCIPIIVDMVEAKLLNETMYYPDKADVDAIESRLLPLLDKESNADETQVLYSTSVSSFNRVPYLSGSALDTVPNSTWCIVRFCYLAVWSVVFSRSRAERHSFISASSLTMWMCQMSYVNTSSANHSRTLSAI